MQLRTKARRPSGLALFMTKRALDADALLAMTVHAAAHGEVGFARELGTRRDGAVAIFARGAGFRVRAMAEENKNGKGINANPLDLMVVLSGVAAAADSGLGQGHGFAGIGVRMASGTLQLEIACM